MAERINFMCKLASKNEPMTTMEYVEEIVIDPSIPLMEFRVPNFMGRGKPETWLFRNGVHQTDGIVITTHEGAIRAGGTRAGSAFSLIAYGREVKYVMQDHDGLVSVLTFNCRRG
jgi:hypothetical protein